MAGLTAGEALMNRIYAYHMIDGAEIEMTNGQIIRRVESLALVAGHNGRNLLALPVNIRQRAVKLSCCHQITLAIQRQTIAARYAVI